MSKDGIDIGEFTFTKEDVPIDICNKASSDFGVRGKIRLEFSGPNLKPIGIGDTLTLNGATFKVTYAKHGLLKGDILNEQANAKD